MKKLALIFLLSSPIATAGAAIFSHEIDTGGLVKQCVYDYYGDPYVITIKSYKLCPITIKV